MVLEGPLIHHLEVSKQGFVLAVLPFGKIQTRFCISWPTIQNHLGNQHCNTVISPFKITIVNGFKWCINLYEKGTNSRRVNDIGLCSLCASPQELYLYAINFCEIVQRFKDFFCCSSVDRKIQKNVLQKIWHWFLVPVCVISRTLPLCYLFLAKLCKVFCCCSKKLTRNIINIMS